MNQFHNGSNKENGNTLATVLILMTVLGIIVMIFLSSQTISLQGFKNRKLHLQALAESRSMVMTALAKLPKMNLSDTSAINKPLFEDSTTTEKDSATLETTPFSVTITGECRSPIATVVTSAETGTTYTPGDTTLMFCTASTVEAPNISGVKVVSESDSSKGTLPLNSAGVAKAKKWITDFASKATSKTENPVVIGSQGQYESLSDTVNGPLFFHGSSGELRVDGKNRKIMVCGDIQFTGKVTCRNLNLISSGEVRINDRTVLKGCDIVAGRRFFLADESIFSGRAAALEQVEIYGSSKVMDESLIISFAGKKEETGSDSSAVKNQKAAISVREQAQVSGSLIAVGKDGILTELSTKTMGILWSKTWIRHNGSHKGFIRAVEFRGEPGTEQPGVGTGQPTVQQIAGRVEPPFSRIPYPLPWYIGKPKLISWREWNR